MAYKAHTTGATRRPSAGCAWALACLSMWTCAHACAASPPTALAADPAALADAMRDVRVVMLGEVHDNGFQHELRAAALRILVANGARPAIAFEQFDRERQPDIDRARRERPRDADYLIAQAKSGAWDWSFYRPFIALALEYDLPIVAANLSRKDAMKVAMNDWSAVFDDSARRNLQLDTLPEDVRKKHEQAIADGHCQQLPASTLPAMARAQIARDIVLAQAMAPYASRGVVLIAGNGHVRRDIGVPLWLSAAARGSLLSVGILERDTEDSANATSGQFDRVIETKAVTRPDPCKDLAARLPALPGAGKKM